MRHLPNLICLARILLVWPIVAALVSERHALAAALFVIAAVSDGLDGFLAKRFHWTSELGKFLDPLADKLLLIAVFLSATWTGIVPPWLTAAAVSRDVMIGLGALVFSLWLGPLRGHPTLLSKLNTFLQLGYLLAVMLHAASGLDVPLLLTLLAGATFVTTVISGFDYTFAFTRRAWAQRG